MNENNDTKAFLEGLVSQGIKRKAILYKQCPRISNRDMFDILDIELHQTITRYNVLHNIIISYDIIPNLLIAIFK